MEILAISTSNHPVPLDTRKADGSTQCPLFTASASEAVTEWSLSDGGSRLHVRHDGTMILVMPGVDSSRQHLALTLPEGAVNIPARERSLYLGAPEDAALSLYWPGGIFLNVWCASSSFSSETRDKFSQWTRGIDEGYLIEVVIERKSLEDQAGIKGAELSLELSQDIHWFGGAHMLRQIWPLDRAQWETGRTVPCIHQRQSGFDPPPAAVANAPEQLRVEQPSSGTAIKKGDPAGRLQDDVEIKR